LRGTWHCCPCRCSGSWRRWSVSGRQRRRPSAPPRSEADAVRASCTVPEPPLPVVQTKCIHTQGSPPRSAPAAKERGQPASHARVLLLAGSTLAAKGHHAGCDQHHQRQQLRARPAGPRTLVRTKGPRSGARWSHLKQEEVAAADARGLGTAAVLENRGGTVCIAAAAAAAALVLLHVARGSACVARRRLCAACAATRLAHPMRATPVRPAHRCSCTARVGLRRQRGLHRARQDTSEYQQQ
jgi:hypothetical protein